MPPLLAIDAASRGLTQAPGAYCVVAAVDSYLMPETIEWIESCDQLHGAGNLNNAWGFIPGESASALLLHAAYDTNACLAQVAGLGVGNKARRIKSDGVCLGEGLTQALRGALETLPMTELVDNIFCDMSRGRSRRLPPRASRVSTTRRPRGSEDGIVRGRSF